MNIEKQHQSLPIPLDERLMENIIGTGLKPKFLKSPVKYSST